MRKFIALALSFIMALALCTTAFAVVPMWKENVVSETTFDTFDATYNTKTNEAPVTFTHVAAKTPTYKDGVCVAAGNIEFYKDADDNYYVMSDKWSKGATLAVKPHDANLAVGEQAAPDAVCFLTKVNAVSYNYEGKTFTAWGDKCGQYKKPADADKVKYIDSKLGICPVADGNEALAAENSNVLVDGKIYSADQSQKQEVIAHNWLVNTKNDKGENLTYKCTICGTIGTVVESSFSDAAKDKTLVKIGDELIAFTYAVDKATDNKKAASPKTFDSGVAMYIGMGLMSTIGTATLIKKKEF